ncbi:Putative tyrosine-protein kinase YveL [bacterium HR17]|uniref:Tyrosine-protein kinase YveL n=1 Tax=Candidatus Fervidibacter japonicus TaxID=2035412 RepID=A0A2H5XA58_9BACT|nr:Putative tyrosine-protein kinase YveL [bacterium HR17]
MMQRTAGQTTSPHRESDLLLYFWAVSRRWPLIVLMLVLAALGAVAYMRLTPPTYEAVSLVRMRKPTPVQVFGTGTQPAPEQEMLNLNTAAQLVMTYLTAQEALDLLQKPPLRDRLSRTTREYLRLFSPQEVLQVTKTAPIEPDLVRITVHHPLPEVAAALANGLAEAFVQRLNRETRAEASNERRFIESQLQLIEGQLRQLDTTIAQVYRQLRSVDVSEETKSLIESLRTYTTDLMTVESELRSLQASIAQLRRAAARQGPVMSVQVLKEDPTVQELQRQLAMLEVDRANLVARYTPDHPAVREVDERMNALRNAINQRVGRVVKGAETVPNPSYATLQQHLMDLETRRLSAEARRQALLALLQQAQKQIEQLPEDRRRVGELNRRLQVLEQAYTSLLGRLQDAQIREASRLGNAMIADVATVPQRPVSPNLPRVALLALLAGLAAGIGAALLLEMSKSSVETTEEVRHLLNAPVLGIVPQTHTPLTQTQVAELMHSQRRAAEAIRTLRSNLKFLGRKRPFRTLVITSAVGGEGKTFLTAALGLAYAHAGYRVILVDADLRHPSLHQRFKLTDGIGLREVLEGTVSLDEALRSGPMQNLWVLPAGTPPPTPAELLDSPSMQKLLGALRERADIVLLDTPPLLAVTDAILLAPIADGFLMVVATNTPRVALTKAREQMELAEAPLLGAVLNRVTSKSMRGYYDYYGYYGAPD